MSEKIFSQEELMQLLISEFKLEGVLFKKVKTVLARKAKEGEQINTITSDGLETTNTAKKGSFIIKNQTEAEELYIIGGSKFKDRYEFLEEVDSDFSRYSAKGKVFAIEMTSAFLKKMNLKDTFYFIAPWKEEMITKKGDFLVCPPDYSEIYRIARKEFFETYSLN